jgi:effector-binding domain-containing protein
MFSEFAARIEKEKITMSHFMMFGIILASSFLASCTSVESFIKATDELPKNEGIVIFPIEVNETFVNGNTLFVEKHASSCFMQLYNPDILETTSMFPIDNKNITAPKSWPFIISKKYYHIPNGTYITSTLDFNNYTFFCT